MFVFKLSGIKTYEREEQMLLMCVYKIIPRDILICITFNVFLIIRKSSQEARVSIDINSCTLKDTAYTLDSGP